MAEINITDVRNIAKLAKLEFSENELKEFSEQFNKIVSFVEKIGELDTDNIQPTTHAVEKHNVLRRDEVHASLPSTEIEKVAPKFIDGNIVVPKVIEH